MKKIDLGHAVQILANVGVVVGIIFLVLEINQNNEQQASQARYNYYQERLDILRDLALNGELSEIFVKATSGDPLSGTETLRLGALFESTLVAWEYEYGEFRRGRITPEEFNIAAKRNRFEGLSFGIGPAWDAYSTDAPEDFVKFVEQEIIRE
jgi:hypothetical protein